MPVEALRGSGSPSRGERRVQHGDEREFLEATIEAVAVLYDLLELNDRQHLMKRREEWQGHSEKF